MDQPSPSEVELKGLYVCVNQALDSFDQNTSQSRSVPFAFHIKLGKRTLCSAAKMTALPCYPQW